MQFGEVVFRLPDWVVSFLPECKTAALTVEDRMSLVVELARRNIEHGTGGPFGAGVFEQETGQLIAPGVNLVEQSNCSIAHAEIIALALAQMKLSSYDLNAGARAYDLVTSTEPCAMCLGAIGWCGVRRVVCGARDEDARRIGFDEGSKPIDWIGSLEGRGIVVLRDVLREQARAVLEQYADSGGLIYNTRHRPESSDQ